LFPVDLLRITCQRHCFFSFEQSEKINKKEKVIKQYRVYISESLIIEKVNERGNILMESFKKKEIKAGVLAIIICAMFIGIALSGCTQQQQNGGTTEIKNPTTLVRYDIGDAKTLDPADC